MTARLRALAAAAAAAAGLAALAPHAAQAQTRYVYDAHFDLRASYEMKESSDDGVYTREQRAGFRMKGVVQYVNVIEGRVVSSEQTEQVRTSDVFGAEETIRRDSPLYVRTCRNAGMELRGPGMLYPTSLHVRRADPLSITFVPFPWVHMWMQCDKDNPQRITFGGLPHGGGARTTVNDHFRLAFRIPRDELGAARITVPVSNHEIATETCPGDHLDRPSVRTCISDLEGTVTLVKRGTWGESDEDDVLVPLVPNRPAVDRRARRAEVEVRCPSGCRYRIRTFLPRGRLGRASASAAAMAGTTLSVTSGRLGASRRDRTIAIPLAAKHRPAILRANIVMFEIELDPPSGKTVRRMGAAIPGI